MDTTITNNVTVQSVVSPGTAKQRQYTYDGLGRLSSVCELTAGSSTYPNGPCSAGSSTNGYVTNYTYDVLNDLTGVAQNAQSTTNNESRSYQYDMLGRMISETNPESGTTTYTYDAPTTNCTNSVWNGYDPGNLTQKQDANGNVTCYFYDALHRLVATYVAAGPNAFQTCKNYSYDTTSGTYGQGSPGTLTNLAGRLAEAETDDCNWPRKASDLFTDVWFGYDARGEVSDVYQWTAHSGGYYHLTSTYWAHGLVETLGGVPGVPTITYGASMDGEGRVTKVTAGSGQTPITGVAYNNTDTSKPIGALTSLTYGSSDSDAFTYDSHTGRLTQYKFNVGTSNSVTGNLGWNANGTLATLGITDTLNSANTQNCSFSYDDLARLSTANCGNTKWNQSFTYDPYGNITKNVTGTGTSFQSTYSETTNATNRLTLIGSQVPGYDNNGNLTNDTVHNYTWDAEGKMLTVDTNSVTLTYDALGRMAEQNRGGTYTQILYAPTGGKLALMNGQTLVKAFVPLPAGATAVYAPGTTGPIYYRHSDWLGSSRLATTQSRTMYSDGAYGPFGENYVGSGTTDLNFTSQNQDTMQNYYDFMFREYSQVQGRWMSPDPSGRAAVNPMNPQSWNRYAYALNIPTVLSDALGLAPGNQCPRARYGPSSYCKDGTGGDGGGGEESQLGGGIDYTIEGIEVSPSLYNDFFGGSYAGAGVNCPQCKPGDIVDANNLIYRWGQITEDSWNHPSNTGDVSVRILGEWGWIPSDVYADALISVCDGTALFCVPEGWSEPRTFGLSGKPGFPGSQSNNPSSPSKPITNDCATSIYETVTGGVLSTAVVGAVVYFGPEAIVGELLIGADDAIAGAHVLNVIPAPLAVPFVLFGDGVSNIGQNCF